LSEAPNLLMIISNFEYKVVVFPFNYLY